MTRGDYLSIQPADPSQPLYIAQVQSLFSEKGAGHAHVIWMYRGGETVLGEASDPQELFLVGECDDNELEAVHEKVQVGLKIFIS